MLSLKSILSLFYSSSRKLQSKLISTLIDEGLLVTQIPLYYFEMSDDELIEYLNTTIDTSKVPRLFFIYNSLPMTQESMDYLHSLPPDLLGEISNLPLSTTYVNEARSITNKQIPKEIWQTVASHLPRERDTSHLQQISKHTQKAIEEYPSMYQYSIDNEENSGVRYYNNFRLTPYQVEILDLLKEFLNREMAVPDYYNKCVIASVLCLEFVNKRRWKVGIVTRANASSDEEIAMAIDEKNIKDFTTILQSISHVDTEGIVLIPSEVEDIKSYSNDMDIDCLIFIDGYDEGFDEIPAIDIYEAIRAFCDKRESFLQSEVYPVMVSVDDVPRDDEKTLVYDERELFLSDEEILAKLSNKNIVKGKWFPSIEVLNMLDKIVIHYNMVEVIDEVYTLLSQHSKKVKKIVVDYNYLVPLPYKSLLYFFDIFGQFSFSTKNFRICGLTYQDMVIYKHYIPPKTVDRAQWVYGQRYQSITKGTLKYTLKEKDYEISQLIKTTTSKPCYMLMDPNQDILNTPKIVPINLGPEILNKLNIQELKRLLHNRGLAISGKRHDLIERLTT